MNAFRKAYRIVVELAILAFVVRYLWIDGERSLWYPIANIAGAFVAFELISRYVDWRVRRTR